MYLITTKSCVISLFDNDIDGKNSLCIEHFRQMQGCDFCIVVTIPCRCSVSTTNVYAAPRLASCHIHRDNTNVLHPVNLAVLQHFFYKFYVQNILADTNFRKALNVTIPKLKIYKHEMSNVLADDTKA